MSRPALSLVIVFVVLSCATYPPRETYIGNWTEEQYDFTESIQHSENLDLLGSITSYKWCCGTGGDEYSRKQFKWLRDTNNLWTTYNVIKKIGLESFLTPDKYNEILFENDYWDYDWEGLSLNTVVKKFLYAFNNPNDSPEYYTEFWNRRTKEQNDKITYRILKEIDAFYNESTLLSIDAPSLNDTLLTLMEHNLRYNTTDSTAITKTTLEYFDYLKELNLSHSAYNLIYEMNPEISINKDSLLSTLKHDTIPEEKYWQTRNSATWIRTYRDNGP